MLQHALASSLIYANICMEACSRLQEKEPESVTVSNLTEEERFSSDHVNVTRPTVGGCRDAKRRQLDAIGRTTIEV